ncbi:LETM1 domain-containing protein 1 isoform X1 [Alligator sinensis]|uniref:LETM1 domain-containing protein 1 isoform X1 n=1 Tax=Alligator sinensis TaxID=38654 RepID=A0A3Q0HFA3_ALLSI|nr:LETM1 domain-containing protein 1 isoform X1 [Alligator sinensis]
MALPRLNGCWSALRLLPRAGSAWLPGRGAVRPLSSKPDPRPLLSALLSTVKRASGRYERFLERRFPRFYLLYATSHRGFKALFLEAIEIRKIKINMAHQGISFQQLPYRDMERLRQFRRDLIKAIPVSLLSLPPFANYFVLVLIYLFPRQLLIHYFWTPKQQVEFLNIYHGMRREAYPDIIDGLARATQFVADQQIRDPMQRLCTKKALSRVLFLTPHLPTIFLRYRLQNHVQEIQHLDRAMLKLGVKELSDEEVNRACYVRGLNSTRLSPAECREWLDQWLKLSCMLKDSEASLLAHSMVLLSTNYQAAKE